MINCNFYNYKNKKWEQYEIDIKMNLYPCCHYYTDYLLNKKNNATISHIDNNLITNKIENIEKDFKEIFNEKNWNSDKCPELCWRICSTKKNKKNKKNS